MLQSSTNRISSFSRAKSEINLTFIISLQERLMVNLNQAKSRREDSPQESISYIRQMLGELRQVARGEGADMLCYLIEMAYVEAGDVQAGRRPRSLLHR